MRELILKMSITIDGFVASADGGNQWVADTRDPKAGEWMVETLWGAGMHVMGSRSFHDWARYWPTATTIFAPPMNQIPKAVFSRRGTAVLAGIDTTPAAESWAKAYVAAGDLTAEVAKLKSQEGKPIMAHGGVVFARSLVAAGLVDRYILMVHPVVLGKGLPLFADLPAPRILELVSATTFPRGGIAKIYRPA